MDSNTPKPVDNDWDVIDADIQPWRPDNRGFLQRAWGQCGGVLSCTCATGGSAVLSHAGCIISPIVSLSLGSVGIMAEKPVMIGISLTASFAGAVIWHQLRGPHASRLEQGLTYTGMAVGTVIGMAPHIAELDAFNNAIGFICGR